MKLAARWLAVVALAGLTAASCSINHRSGSLACEHDADCEGGGDCVDNVCIGRPGPVDAAADTPDPARCPAQCTSCDATTHACKIDCSANPDACRSMVTCPPGWGCEVLCTEDASCRTGVTCAGATSCKITCSGQGACRNLTCGGDACTLTCSGQGSCRNVACGATSCNLACSGQGACNAINCGTDRCNVNCSGPGACTDVDCGSACACDVACSDTAFCDNVTCRPGCKADPTAPLSGCASTATGCDVCQ